MLLNIVVFMWYGAVAPWPDFRTNDVIPIYRLIALGILILLFRRIPMVLLFRHHLKEIGDWQQALFVGFFGPIGVSAVFYLYVSLDFLDQIVVDGEVREDAAKLREVIRIVVWFLAITSIVVHGLSVPLGKLGYTMPRTISQALSSESEQRRPMDRRRVPDPSAIGPRRAKKQESRKDPPPNTQFVLGQRGTDQNDEPFRPVRIIEDGEDLEMQMPVDRKSEQDDGNYQKEGMSDSIQNEPENSHAQKAQ